MCEGAQLEVSVSVESIWSLIHDACDSWLLTSPPPIYVFNVSFSGVVMSNSFSVFKASFERLSQFTVYCLVRAVGDPSELVSEAIIQRIGPVFETSARLLSDEEWEQVILFEDPLRTVEDRTNFELWNDYTRDSTILARKHGLAADAIWSHSDIAAWVVAITREFDGALKTECGSNITSDPSKGIITTIHNIADRSARYCAILEERRAADSSSADEKNCDDHWLQRFQNEYEKLVPLSSIPESERLAEFERREAIRRALYELPDAPKPSSTPARHTAYHDLQSELIAEWVNGSWSKEDHDSFRTWWRIQKFAPDRRPSFRDEDLQRRTKNLALLFSDLGKQSRMGVPPEDVPDKDEQNPSTEKTQELATLLPQPPKRYGAGEDGLRRDAKIYELAKAKWTNGEIAKEIEQLASDENWESISANHVSVRLKEYCQHMVIPMLSRRGGRPKAKTS